MKKKAPLTTEKVRKFKPCDVPQCPVEFVEQIRKWGDDNRNGGTIEWLRPEEAAIALWRMAQGVSMSRISRETNIKRETLLRMRWRHEDTLESKRKEFSKHYAQAAQVYTDLLFDKADRLAENPELLDAISPDRLALTVGIMTDKAAQLSGMAGTIIEVRKGVTVDDAAKMINEAKQRIANKVKREAIEAQVTE